MGQFVILEGVRFIETSILRGSTFGNMFWKFQRPYYTSQRRADKCNLNAQPQQHAQLTFVFNFQFSFEEVIGFDYCWGIGSIPALFDSCARAKLESTNAVFATRCRRKVRGGPTRHADSTCQARHSYDSRDVSREPSSVQVWPSKSHLL